MSPPPRKYAAAIAAQITRMEYTVDSSPYENPDKMVVAGPVWVAAAMSFTGFRFVEVKYSVSTWIAAARTRPMTTAHATRRSEAPVSGSFM